MRPIDGDRLMMNMNDWWYSSFGRVETDESRAIKTVLDKIEQSLGMFAMEQDRWIPVTDRLPEEDCSCRVTEGDFKSVFDCSWSNHKKQFEVWSYYNDCYMPITNVTAWKPIEEPYKEEEA